MYEVRKRTQKDEDARKMCWTKSLVEKIGNKEKTPSGRT